MGIDLPRTPLVFLAKERWSLAEQEEWGGNSSHADAWIGAWHTHYSAAVEHADAVARTQRTSMVIVSQTLI